MQFLATQNFPCVIFYSLFFHPGHCRVKVPGCGRGALWDIDLSCFRNLVFYLLIEWLSATIAIADDGLVIVLMILFLNML